MCVWAAPCALPFATATGSVAVGVGVGLATQGLANWVKAMPFPFPFTHFFPILSSQEQKEEQPPPFSPLLKKLCANP